MQYVVGARTNTGGTSRTGRGAWHRRTQVLAKKQQQLERYYILSSEPAREPLGSINPNDRKPSNAGFQPRTDDDVQRLDRRRPDGGGRAGGTEVSRRMVKSTNLRVSARGSAGGGSRRHTIRSCPTRLILSTSPRARGAPHRAGPGSIDSSALSAGKRQPRQRRMGGMPESPTVIEHNYIDVSGRSSSRAFTGRSNVNTAVGRLRPQAGGVREAGARSVRRGHELCRCGKRRLKSLGTHQIHNPLCERAGLRRRIFEESPHGYSGCALRRRASGSGAT